MKAKRIPKTSPIYPVYEVASSMKQEIDPEARHIAKILYEQCLILEQSLCALPLIITHAGGNYKTPAMRKVQKHLDHLIKTAMFAGSVAYRLHQTLDTSIKQDQRSKRAKKNGALMRRQPQRKH